MYYQTELTLPEDERKIFTNREREISKLKFYLSEFKQKKKENVAIFGLRRIGKTVLIKKFLFDIRKENFIPIYINIQRIIGEPKDFSLSLVSSILFYVYHKADQQTYLSKNSLLNQTLYNPKLYPYLERIFNELEKMRPDYRFLLESSFNLLVKIEEIEKKKIILSMDEFQDILQLEKFKGLKNILGIIRYYISLSQIWFIILGSSISILDKIVNEKKSPLFLQFSNMKVSYLDKHSSKILGKKIFDKLNDNLLNLIYRYTNGHPAYLNYLTRRIKELATIYNYKLDFSLVQRSLLIEILGSEGRINELCDYIFTTSLDRAKYKVPLKTILRILSKQDGLTQSEIGRIMKKSQGEIRNYLLNLKTVDLISETKNKYYIIDPLLRFWISYKEFGIEKIDFQSKDVIEKTIKDLEEKYLQASSELGKAKEYELKYELEKKFGLKLENYRKEKIEFDLVGKKSGVWHVFEVKWKSKPAEYTDLKKFHENANKVFGKCRLYFVSKSGFSEQAKKFAEKNAIELIEKSI